MREIKFFIVFIKATGHPNWLTFCREQICLALTDFIDVHRICEIPACGPKDSVGAAAILSVRFLHRRITERTRVSRMDSFGATQRTYDSPEGAPSA